MAQLKAIKLLIKTSGDLKKFKFYNSFKNKWIKVLNDSYNNDRIFIQNNICDLDQIYQYKFFLKDTEFNFDFSIKYIRDYFAFDKSSFPIVTLKNNNGNVTYGDFDCLYNYYNTVETGQLYDDLTDIFLMQFPDIPLKYIVIDGNHRLSEQISKGVKNIPVKFCLPEVCKRSIISYFQLAIFECLNDYVMIIFNMNKVSDLQIKKKLNIFNPKSFINNPRK